MLNTIKHTFRKLCVIILSDEENEKSIVIGKFDDLDQNKNVRSCTFLIDIIYNYLCKYLYNLYKLSHIYEINISNNIIRVLLEILQY